MKAIAIDSVTRQRLIDITVQVRDLNNLFAEIQNTYIRAKGGKGKYKLSQDATQLLPEEMKDVTT